MAQNPPAPKSDGTTVGSQEPTQASPTQELNQKTTDDGKPVLSALPPQDTSQPPGLKSKVVVIALIVAGAAAITALIIALRGGGDPQTTVLTPGTPTVRPPGH